MNPHRLKRALRAPLVRLKHAVAPRVRCVAHRSGLSTAAAWAQPVMRIIMLHAVDDDECPMSTFVGLLEHLSRRFSIVPLDTLVERASRPGYVPRGEVALTFDDGQRNNYTRAYPILQHFNAPATIYVCPGNVEEGRWIWTIDALLRLRGMSPGQREELARHFGLEVSDVESIHSWLKSLPNDVRKQAFDDLLQASSAYVPSRADRDKCDMMSWDELRSLDPRLITIGSHTVTHPMLSGCSPEERDYEIRESQAWLERMLDRPVRHFCYPDANHDDDVVQRVQRCYDSAVTAVGLVRPGRADPFRLPRIPVTDDLAYLVWRLHRPGA